MNIIDWNTDCDLGSGSKTHAASAPALKRCSAYRYNGALYPTRFKKLGGGVITFNGKRLTWDGDKLLLDGSTVKDFSGTAFVSKPVFNGRYEYTEVRSINGIANMLCVNITGSTEAEIDFYPAETNGTFDLTKSPAQTIQKTIRDLQGRTNVYLIQNTFDILVKSPTGFSINDITYPIALSDELYSCKFEDGVYLVCEQYNDNKVTGVNVYGRMYIIAGASVDSIAGSWCENRYTNGVADGVTAYFLHDKKQHTGAEVGDAISYTRLFNETDWHATVYQIPTEATEQNYSETFFPGDNILFTYDTAIGAYLWRTANGIVQMEGSLLDGNLIPATDYARQKEGDIFISRLSTLFNRARIDPVSKAAVIWSNGTPFAASYNTVLVAPAAQINTCTIVNINSVTYFVINNKYVVAVGLNIPRTVELVSGDLYKINAADPHNLLQVTKDDAVWNVGSVDWNNRIQPTQVLALNNSSYAVDISDASICSWNSAYGANYEADDVRSTSLLVGSPSLTSYSQSNQRLKSDTVLYWPEVPRSYPLDYYWKRTSASNVDTTPIYVNTDFKTERTRLSGLAYPEPESATIALPFPVNATYSRAYANIVAVTWGNNGWTTINKGKTVMAGYFLSASLGADEVLFYLAGSYYSYDGDAVWRLEQEKGVVVNYAPSARAAGLIFCGASTEAAYFWSPIDKVVYTYKGDDTLSASMRITTYGELKTASYCQADDTISLCFEAGYVAIRHTLISTYDLIVDDVNISALGTLLLIGGVWQTPRPHTGWLTEADTLIPVILETEILGGADDMETVNFTRLGIKTEATKNIKIINTAYSRKVKTETAVIPHGVENDAVSMFNITPKTTNSNGVSFTVECDKPVFCVDYDISTDRVIANKAGRSII